MPDVENKGNLGTIHNLQERSDKKNADRKKSSTGKNPTSLSSAQKQALFADWLNGNVCEWMEQNGIKLKKPSKSFVFLRSLDGSKQLYEVTPDRDLVDCHLDAVEEQISGVVHGEFRDLLDMTAQHIEGAVKYWSKVTPSIETPPLYGFQGDDHLVMRRLPFKLENGPTPLFDEMFSRIDNGLALKIFVGSLFFPKSNRQQYVWMYGKGNDGKGTFVELLGEVLKHTFSSQVEPSFNDRFWTYSIKDARLVVFPDTNNTSFVTSGLLKSLTGNDSIRVEKKGGRVFTIKPMAKLIFVSNSKPGISSEISDKRRIIYCEWKPFSGEPQSHYDDLLREELPYFISKCIELYLDYCPNNELIKRSTDSINSIIDDNETPYHFIIEKYCVVSPELKTARGIMWELICDHFSTKKERLDFKKWLGERFILKGSKRPGTNHVDYWWEGIGVSINPLYIRTDQQNIR